MDYWIAKRVAQWTAIPGMFAMAFAEMLSRISPPPWLPTNMYLFLARIAMLVFLVFLSAFIIYGWYEVMSPSFSYRCRSCGHKMKSVVHKPLWKHPFLLLLGIGMAGFFVLLLWMWWAAIQNGGRFS
jgi:hypothetical protein